MRPDASDLGAEGIEGDARDILAVDFDGSRLRIDEAREERGEGPGFLRIGGDDGDFATGGNFHAEFVEEDFFRGGMDVGDGIELEHAREGSEEFGSDHLADGGDLFEISLQASGNFDPFALGETSLPEAFEGEVKPEERGDENQSGTKGEIVGREENFDGDEIENQSGAEDQEELAAPACETLIFEDSGHEIIVTGEVLFEAVAGEILDVEAGGEAGLFEAFGEESKF